MIIAEKKKKKKNLRVETWVVFPINVVFFFSVPCHSILKWPVLE